MKFSTLLFLTALCTVHSFAPHIPHTKRTLAPLSKLYIASSLPNVEEMKASELRKELQSYGISTKSFFEKSELVEAVEKARAEGKEPIANGTAQQDTSSSSSSSSSSSDSRPRSERLKEEMDKCSSMKVGELKKELQSYGISTKSFFEKSEFVKAVAEARVDGVKKTSGGAAADEPYDPSFRDVNIRKLSENDRRALLGGFGTRGYIDTTISR